MSPGPCVTATAARSSHAAPASLIASATTSLTSSVWRRDATSGTTPPNSACSSFCDETMDDSTSRPRTTAALVSSQDVSTARMGRRTSACARRPSPSHALSPSQSFHMMTASSRSSL